MKNKKGFTLVELLAVIVVLAIIILIAMPAVMNSMDKARRNALVTEINEMSKIAQTAFADRQMSNAGLTDACFDIKWLVSNGYMDKKIGDKDYTGYIEIKLDRTNFTYSKAIEISNGIYGYGKTSGCSGSSVCGSADPNDAQADGLKSYVKVNTICPGYTTTLTDGKQAFIATASSTPAS